MTYSKEDYLKFKLLLATNMTDAYYNLDNCNKYNIEQMLRLVVKIYGLKALNIITQYCNILKLFDNKARVELLVQPCMLITIDNEMKEIAWLISITNYELEKFCKKLENEL